MKIIELEQGADGVYKANGTVAVNKEPVVRKKKTKEIQNRAPQNPLSDVISVLEAVKGTANAIAKLIK